MLRLAKKMIFAIEAVLDIAYHSSSEPVPSRDITRRQGIPRRYLEQALQHLVRNGLLIGVRGPQGGYRLARERRRITIGDIVRVVSEMESNNQLIEDTPGSELGHKVVRPLWLDLRNEMMARLDKLSVDDLCSHADQAGIISEGRQNLDFTI